MSGKSWDKLILLLAGLVVISISALFSMRALGFSEKFVVPQTTPKNEIPETEVAKTNIAKSYVEKTQTWSDPGKGVAGRPFRFLSPSPSWRPGGSSSTCSIRTRRNSARR